MWTHFQAFVAGVLILLTRVRLILNHLDAFSTISGHSLHLADASPYDFEASGRIFEHFSPQFDFADGASIGFEAFERVFDNLWPQSRFG